MIKLIYCVPFWWGLSRFRFLVPSRLLLFFFFFLAEDGIRDRTVTGVQTCALPICVGGEEVDRLALAEGEGERTGAAVGERGGVEAGGGAEHPVVGGGDGVPGAVAVGAAQLQDRKSVVWERG